ncbi:MAG: hypothetical protein ACTSVV_02915 [Promethearchaeota archaeon]
MKNDENKLKENIKEATELLSCIDLNEKKLENIASNISTFIKENPKMKTIIDQILTSNKKENLNIEDLYEFIEKKNMTPILMDLILELSNNPDVIENIEKIIIPMLFSK